MHNDHIYRQHTHKYFVDSETRDEVCLCGAVKGEARRGNKFGAKRTEYKNQVFDSQFEANYCADLELRKRGGFIKDYKRQVLFHLYAHGLHICDYKLDFLVEYPGGSFEAVETKGRWTPDARIKWKLFEAQMAIEQPHMKLTVEREAKKYYKRKCRPKSSTR